MSYNVDTVKLLKGSALEMATADFNSLLDELEDGGLPEVSFLEYDEDHVDDGETIRLANLWWYGERSGRTWDSFLGKVVPKLKGEGKIVVVWEGGDTIEGYHIKDGVATKYNLVEE